MNIPLDAYVIVCGNHGQLSEVVFPTVEHELSDAEIEKQKYQVNMICISVEGYRPKAEFYCYDYKDVQKYIEKNLLNKYSDFVICRVREQLSYAPQALTTKDKRTRRK